MPMTLRFRPFGFCVRGSAARPIQAVVVRDSLGRRGKGIRPNFETQTLLGLEKAYIREHPSSLSSAWRERDPGA
jgi:hypothetical protein